MKIFEPKNQFYTLLKSNKSLLGIITVSVVLRILMALYLGNQVEILPGTHDQISYHTLAIRFLNGFGFTFGETWWPITAAGSPTAHWSYLYTFYLIGIYKIFGPNPLAARVIQAFLVGIIQPILAYKIGKHVFNRNVGIISAFITSLYIYFIYYSATLMTESFYIVAIMSSLYLSMLLSKTLQGVTTQKVTQLAFFLGITLGMAVLFRQLFLLFIPFIFLWLGMSCLKIKKRNLVGSIFLSTIVVLLMVLPFTISNYSRFNRFVLLNTNAGFAFFWGNHPIYGTHFEPILPPEMGTYQDLIPKELHKLNEAELEQELLKRGINFIIDDPGRYLLLSVSRIPPYFKFWPTADSGFISNISRVFSFGITWPFMLIGFLYAPFSINLRNKVELKSPLLLLYFFIIIYAAVHILTWTLIRYRLPIDAILVIFAALCGLQIWQLIQKMGKSMRESAK